MINLHAAILRPLIFGSVVVGYLLLLVWHPIVTVFLSLSLIVHFVSRGLRSLLQDEEEGE